MQVSHAPTQVSPKVYRSAMRPKPLAPGEVLALPAMVDLVPDASAALGISRDTAYKLARAGKFPIEVIKIGRSMKVRRADLLAFLGIEDNGDSDEVPAA